MPTVSVIIPAYNQCQYVGEAIQSVLDQTLADFDVIVVDDGSTDETADVVQAIDDTRVRYVFQANQGLSAARNTGIRHTDSEYVSYLDSDDLFLPRKLELLVGRLADEPALGMVAGLALPIDELGNRVGRAFDRGLPSQPERLALVNPLHVGSVVVRRAWQERVGLFDTQLRSYEDWDMWLRLALAGCAMTWVDEPVSLYRFHSGQMTRDQGQMTVASFAVLDKVFGRDELPETWRAVEDEAYAQGHLRGAAQAYRSQDWDSGAQHLLDAVKRDPALADEDYGPLANQLAAWADLPKVGDPLDFLDSVYVNLPPELEGLARRRRSDLSEYAVRQAFEANRRQDAAAVRRACKRAFRYQPQRLTNRGIVSIFVRANLAGGKPGSEQASLANPQSTGTSGSREQHG